MCENENNFYFCSPKLALVAELVDALDSKSSVFDVWVRFPPKVQSLTEMWGFCFLSTFYYSKRELFYQDERIFLKTILILFIRSGAYFCIQKISNVKNYSPT